MELKTVTGYNGEKGIKYPKRIFLSDETDYQRILNYLAQVSSKTEKKDKEVFYFLDEEKTKIIKANVSKRTLDFTGNIKEDFFNELEKVIIKNGSN